MAAFTGTPSSSLEYARYLAGTKIAPGTGYAKLHTHLFSYTHTATEGTGTGEVNLVYLPAGRIVIFSDLSRLVSSAFEANADLHLGYRAHTDPDGTAVAEDDNAFLDNADAGGGALDIAWVLPAKGYTVLNSRGGIIIYALIDTGDIAAGDTIEGWVTFAEGN